MNLNLNAGALPAPRGVNANVPHAPVDGYEPTVAGLWEMITDHPSYPKVFGTSLHTGQRLLWIGKAPDPVKADQAERQQQDIYNARRSEQGLEGSVTQPASEGGSPHCCRQGTLDDRLRKVQGVVPGVLRCVKGDFSSTPTNLLPHQAVKKTDFPWTLEALGT
jgi:hypothetical protein